VHGVIGRAAHIGCRTVVILAVEQQQRKVVQRGIGTGAGTQVGDGRFGQVIKPQVVVAPRPRDACEAVIEKRQLLVVGIPGRIGLE
jgi:hypothetical protein